jgi:predicted MPP superfamily phosphohydrolase
MRVIHISDFHLESETPNFHKQQLIKALTKDLAKFVNHETIICFTGDLIDKGGYNFTDQTKIFESFEREFLNVISNEFGILKNRIFFIPGNHDMQRVKVDTYQEDGIKARLINKDSVNHYIQEVKLEKYQIPKQYEFKAFENRYHSSTPNSNITPFDSNFKLEIGGNTIGISCLNSSWRCLDDNDEGNLLIGEKQVTDSLIKIDDCKIKIGLIHHPFHFLKEFDREIVKPLIGCNQDL